MIDNFYNARNINRFCLGSGTFKRDIDPKKQGLAGHGIKISESRAALGLQPVFKVISLLTMSRSFFNQLPRHVPLSFNVPAGRPEIDASKKINVPHVPANVPANPQAGHGVPLYIRGAYVPVGRLYVRNWIT